MSNYLSRLVPCGLQSGNSNAAHVKPLTIVSGSLENPMSSIKLAAGEEIVCEASVSWVAYITALTMLVVLMMTGGLSGLVTTELVITNKRVVGRRGLIRRTNINITHAEISGAQVRRGPLGALFDYGTITILTKAGDRYIFKGITMPFYVAQQIEEAVEVCVLGHKLSDFVGEDKF